MKHNAPFNEEQIKEFNIRQKQGHPYTCDRGGFACQATRGINDGELQVELTHLVCPCGDYRQYWFETGE